MLPRPNQFPTVAAFLRHPTGSRERVLAFRDRQIRRVVREAYASVPYYRRLFDRAGVRPEEIRGYADLHRIPITEKLDLQMLPLDEVLAEGCDRNTLIRRSTSGSQGVPFAIWRTKAEDDLLRVVVTRTAIYHGYRPTQKHVNIVFPRPRGPERWTGRLVRGAGLFRFREIDCRLPPAEILEALRNERPHFISGYSGTLARVARLIDPPEPHLRPKAILAGSEVLTPSMRDQIQSGFQAPVYDTYGSHEFTRIAYQCRDSGALHVCDDSVALEILVDGRPAAVGEPGEAVATALHSFAMPFIRYRLGDVLTRGPETCSCGQPFSTIREVQGRKVDFYTFPGGRTMHPYELMGVINEAIENWWIQEYQLVQEAMDRIVLKAVPLRAPTEMERRVVQTAAEGVLGSGVQFGLEVVGELPLTPGGKFRTYRSYVESSHDEADRP